MGFDADSARAALGRCAWDVNKARSRTWLVGISWNRWFRQRGDHLLVVARIDLTECVSATGTHFCVESTLYCEDLGLRALERSPSQLPTRGFVISFLAGD